jgi:hypothetical protein
MTGKRVTHRLAASDPPKVDAVVRAGQRQQLAVGAERKPRDVRRTVDHITGTDVEQSNSGRVGIHQSGEEVGISGTEREALDGTHLL